MWNTPVALSIVARAPSLRACGYWPMALSIVEAENWKVSAYDGSTERNPRYRLDLLWTWCAAFAIGCQQGLDDRKGFVSLQEQQDIYYQNQPVVQKSS